MAEKLDPAIVLYLPPSLIGDDEGARCGNCMMFIEDGLCSAVSGPINGENGVCGFYVHGDPIPAGLHPSDHEYRESGVIPKPVAGYIEDGPTHCGSCEYYQGGTEPFGSCKKVAAIVAFKGCCNHWERK